MQTLEFETDIVDEFLRIPNFEQFKNKHVRVVIQEGLAPDAIETKAFSNHTANLIEDWKDIAEDDVWK